MSEAPERRESLQVVTVKLGSETYGIPIRQIQEIVGISVVTRVPGLPRFVSGVINLRGKIIPVLNLRRRFGLEEDEASAVGRSSRIVVVEMGEQTAGLEVDSVHQVVRLPPESIEPVPHAIGALGGEYFFGVGKVEKGLIILLDIDKVLSESEKGALESSTLTQDARVEPKPEAAPVIAIAEKKEKAQ